VTVTAAIAAMEAKAKAVSHKEVEQKAAAKKYATVAAEATQREAKKVVNKVAEVE